MGFLVKTGVGGGVVLYISLWGAGFCLFSGTFLGPDHSKRVILVVAPWGLSIRYPVFSLSLSSGSGWDGCFAAVQSDAGENSGLFVVVGRYCMWDAWDDSACRLFAAEVAVAVVVGRYCVRSAWDDSACRMFAAGVTGVGIVWLRTGGTVSRSVWIPVLADSSPAFGNGRLRNVGGCSLGILDLIPGIVAAAAKTDAGAEGKWDAEIMMISKNSKNVENFWPQHFPRLSLGVVKMIDFPDFFLTIA